MTKTNGTGFLLALESEATAQLQEIKSARVYEGSNPEYNRRAKLAIGVIGAYVRLRATMANERSNELISARLLGDKQNLISDGQ